MNIKQHTLQSGERILFVPIHKEIIVEPVILTLLSEAKLLYKKKSLDGRSYKTITKKLPRGNWQLIVLSDEITEEQAELVIDTINDEGLIKHFNYIKGYHYHSLFTAIESFKSLMQSLGCEGVHAVLKEVKA